MKKMGRCNFLPKTLAQKFKGNCDENKVKNQGAA